MILLGIWSASSSNMPAEKAHLIKTERSQIRNCSWTVRDDGKGFANVKGNELHTVRDRAVYFSVGQVSLVSLKHPTEVHASYKEAAEMKVLVAEDQKVC